MKTSHTLAAGAAVVAVGFGCWTLGRADARQPGTAADGADSFSDFVGSGISGGIRVVINGTNELAAIVPAPATTAPIAEGGDDTGTQ